MDPLIIIGTGIAGYTLAREFRKLDKETPLLIVTADDGRSYPKPMLSNALTKGKTAEQIAMFDAVAILALAGVAAAIAYRAWPVLAKTVKNGSTANTTLETPLWIPQTLWFAGWAWFAMSAGLIAASVLIYVVSGKFDEVDKIAGLRGET